MKRQAPALGKNKLTALMRLMPGRFDVHEHVANPFDLSTDLVFDLMSDEVGSSHGHFGIHLDVHVDVILMAHLAGHALLDRVNARD